MGYGDNSSYDWIYGGDNGGLGKLFKTDGTYNTGSNNHWKLDPTHTVSDEAIHLGRGMTMDELYRN
jgi:hypothetical protein